MELIERTLMRATSILGVILIGIGIMLLAYFASPMRLMFQSPIGPHTINPLPPALGGLALLCGIALLFATGPKNK
jgi:hypothetical protein